MILATYTVAHALPGIGVYLIRFMIITEPLSGLSPTRNGIAERDTCPGVGSECDCYCGTYTYQGARNPFFGASDRLIPQFKRMVPGNYLFMHCQWWRWLPMLTIVKRLQTYLGAVAVRSGFIISNGCGP